MSTLRSALGAVVILTVTLAAGLIGSQFPVGEWYASLAKPTWSPPNSIFGPVWGVLYLVIALSAWLVWRKSGLAAAAIPFGLFALQLILNGAWSWLFFGRHQIGLALIEILVLWLAILGTTIAFWRLNTLSGVLMLPYLLWVTFASALNLAIWRLNA